MQRVKKRVTYACSGGQKILARFVDLEWQSKAEGYPLQSSRATNFQLGPTLFFDGSSDIVFLLKTFKEAYFDVTFFSS